MTLHECCMITHLLTRITSIKNAGLKTTVHSSLDKATRMPASTSPHANCSSSSSAGNWQALPSNSWNFKQIYYVRGEERQTAKLPHYFHYTTRLRSWRRTYARLTQLTHFQSIHQTIHLHHFTLTNVPLCCTYSQLEREYNSPVWLLSAL